MIREDTELDTLEAVFTFATRYRFRYLSTSCRGTVQVQTSFPIEETISSAVPVKKNSPLFIRMISFVSGGCDVIKDDVIKRDIGMVITSNNFFEANKRLFFEIKRPIMTMGKNRIEDISKGVILSAGEEIESQSAAILDCCSQLDIPISLYHFSAVKTSDSSIAEHFDNLSKIFGRKVEIIENSEKNPILRLKNEENLLQFVLFTKKMSRRDPLAMISNDMNRLYAKLSDNYQIFIPTN